MKSDDTTIINTLRILARDIESEDGVANAALQEAAERFTVLVEERRRVRGLMMEAAQRLEDNDYPLCDCEDCEDDGATLYGNLIFELRNEAQG